MCLIEYTTPYNHRYKSTFNKSVEFDMPKLNLKSLWCEVGEEVAGPDEAYLTVNNVRVWGPESINNQEGRSLAGVHPIDFSTSAEIKLYDEDTGTWIDPHDHLGTVTATADQAGKGEQRGKFGRYGVDYTLTWVVDP